MRRTPAGGQRQRHRVDVTRILGRQQDRSIGWRYVTAGKQLQAEFSETLFGKLRDKCLNEHFCRRVSRKEDY